MAYYGGYPGPQYPYPAAPSPTRQFYQEQYINSSPRPIRPSRPPSPTRGGMPRRNYNTRKVDPYDYGPDSVSNRLGDIFIHDANMVHGSFNIYVGLLPPCKQKVKKKFRS